MEGCTDAAYQAVLHDQEEASKAGDTSHQWITSMSEDEAADYLDSFIANGGGQLMNDGTTGWYDAERGLIIIQKNDHSATAYSLAYEEFLKNLAGKG